MCCSSCERKSSPDLMKTYWHNNKEYFENHGGGYSHAARPEHGVPPPGHAFGSGRIARFGILVLLPATSGTPMPGWPR